MQNALHEWLTSVARRIAEDYDRLRAEAAASASNIQQVGHGGESTWVRFLQEWLPPGYEVERRKYILPEVGEDAFETDLVVFSKAYPTALRQQERVLASGVAAAFSVKLTANAAGLREAAESASQLSRGLKLREGTPRQELMRPFPYAYLAHSHSWRSEGSTPLDNVSRNLEENDRAISAHPREALDAACIADLGFWRQIRSPYIPPMADLEPEAFATSAILALKGELDETLPPVALFIAWLYSQLALKDPTLAELSAGFTRMGTGGAGSGTMRRWALAQVFSERVRQQLPQLAFGRGGPDWGNAY